MFSFGFGDLNANEKKRVCFFWGVGTSCEITFTEATNERDGTVGDREIEWRRELDALGLEQSDQCGETQQIRDRCYLRRDRHSKVVHMIGERSDANVGVLIAVQFVDVAIPLRDRTWFLGRIAFGFVASERSVILVDFAHGWMCESKTRMSNVERARKNTKFTCYTNALNPF